MLLSFLFSSENFPPRLQGPDLHIARVGHTASYVFNASDNGEFTVSVSGPAAGEHTLTQEGSIFNFTWSPTSSASIELVFVAHDLQNSSALLQPRVELCACENGGQCLPTSNPTTLFELNPCNCTPGIACSDFFSCVVAFITVCFVYHSTVLICCQTGTCHSNLRCS